MREVLKETEPARFVNRSPTLSAFLESHGDNRKTAIVGQRRQRETSVYDVKENAAPNAPFVD